MIAVSGLFSDPQQVYMDSKPFLEKWLLSATLLNEKEEQDDTAEVEDEG